MHIGASVQTITTEGHEGGGGGPNPSSQPKFGQNPSYQIFGVYNGIICIDVLDF